MTAYTATQDTIAAIWAKLQPGDTLKLDGTITGWRPANRAFSTPVQIDATSARLVDFYAANVEGVSIYGGQWTPGPQYKVGLRADRSKRWEIRYARFTGESVSSGSGLWMMGCSDLIVEDCAALCVTTGMAFIDVVRLVGRGLSAHQLGGDGIDLYGVQDGLINGADIGDFQTVGGLHADAVQMASNAFDPKQPERNLRTERVTIRKVVARGVSQGVTAFNHPNLGNRGFSNITIEDCDLELDTYNGIAIYDGEDCVIRNNALRTAEGSAAFCRIVTDRCTGLVRTGNTVAGHTMPSGRVMAAESDAPVLSVAPSTPETIEITLQPGQRLVVTGAS